MLNERFNHLQQIMTDLSDPQDRLQYFVELAAECNLTNSEKVSCFLVPGCISRLWIVPEFRNGRCYFHCDGDAVVPKGVASALLKIFSGSQPQDILRFNPEKIEMLGLKELLAPNRRNALSKVLDTVRAFALAVSKDSELGHAVNRAA